LTRFVHLHLHTKYSLLDGMCRPEDIIETAKKYNMTAVAATEHGNMYGAIEFHSALSKAGIKPIIGYEAYIVDNIKDNKRKKNHLLLLVKNDEGYKNLIKIASYGFTEGFYYKPTIDKKFLSEHTKGLIAMTSCVHGEVPSMIIEGDMEGAREKAQWYLEQFGEGNFYLEMQNHGLNEELLANRGLKELSKAMSVPLVVTNDVHYMTKEDAKAHEILQCVQTGKTIRDSERMQFKGQEMYFKNYEEMHKAFPEDSQAIINAFDVAQKCNFEMPKPGNGKSYYMPSYEVEGGDYNSHFEKLARQTASEKYPDMKPEIKERLEHEIAIINKMGYSGYFLIVRDIIDHARKNNIPVGPGRGSAAGSLVSYILGITSIDPIKYNLLFERFLNPERVSPPDIDIDFSDEERDKVIEFIVNKFGRDKVAQIATFQTLKPRQAIRDVGRVLDIPLNDVDLLAKKVPEGPNMSFDDVLKNDEFRGFVNADPIREEIVNYAIKIEGLLRQDSTHAAGVVIAPDTLTNFVPIAVPKDKDGSGALNYMTQYPMESLEKIGLLKFDILGLRNLSVIKKALRMINENTGNNITLETDGFTDPDVYEMMAKGNTQGMFQLESDGMRDILKKIKPEKFEDIVAIISLFRPGPMDFIPEYIKYKKGQAKPDYLGFPELEQVLKETYGIPIYQEQVMQIAVIIAGFSMAEADNLRRAMAKKKASEMDKIKVKFIESAAKMKRDKDKVSALFESLIGFAQYGFNKSHAAAYGVLAYQTGWLKVHYPAEFMAALLTSVMGSTEKTAQYVADANENQIKVLPPDVNSSDAEFTTERGMVRYGMAAVKNVGVSAALEIASKRKTQGPYKNIYDFCERVNLRAVNSKTIESLIKAGAFDSTLSHRAQVHTAYEDAMRQAERVQKDMEIGQFNLFESESKTHKMPDVPEWTESEQLSAEKEVLGLYVSSHPLAKFARLLKNVSVPIKELALGKMKDGEQVIAGGVVHNITRKLGRDGSERMHFTLEDTTGKILVIVRESVLKDKAKFFLDNIMFLVRGRLRYFDDGGVYVSLESVISLSDAYSALGKYLHIRLREVAMEESTLSTIRNILGTGKGTQVLIHLIARDSHETIAELEDEVTLSEELLLKLEAAAGDENVWFTWKKQV